VVAIFVFLIGCISAALGRQVVITGHEYYRRVIYRKTLIEDLLGRLEPLPQYESKEALLTLATTSGMRTREILNDPNAYFSAPLRRDSITHSLRLVLGTFLFVDACGIGVACYQLLTH